jgi:ArsR family transcriptional regulator
VDDARIVELCKALGDDIRWRIVAELRTGTVCACDLSTRLGIAPSLLSHHLAVLRDAGIVTSKRNGRRVDYSLTADTLAHLGILLATGVSAASAA